MRYAVFAPLEGDETDGQPLVYGDGVVMGRAISANVTFDRADSRLYADDVVAESDNGITGGSLSIGVDHLADDVLVTVLGCVRGENGVIKETANASPYGGVGYVRTMRHRGVNKYVAYWLHKVQLGIASEDAETKGDTLNWQTPVLTGSLMTVLNDESMVPQVRDRQTFDTPAEAYAWINERAHITNAATNATTGTEGAQ